jgi:hypothetical protein
MRLEPALPAQHDALDIAAIGQRSEEFFLYF